MQSFDMSKLCNIFFRTYVLQKDSVEVYKKICKVLSCQNFTRTLRRNTITEVIVPFNIRRCKNACSILNNIKFIIITNQCLNSDEFFFGDIFFLVFNIKHFRYVKSYIHIKKSIFYRKVFFKTFTILQKDSCMCIKNKIRYNLQYGKC